MSPRTIEVVELFAGVGGFRLGLEGYDNPEHPEFYMPAAGPYKTVWANQWEPPGSVAKQFAWRCYEARFGEGSCVNEDINKVLGEHELPALVFKAASLSGDTECLAGASAHDNICFSMKLTPVGFCHVSQVGNVRKSRFEHGRGEGIHLREGKGLEAQRLPGDACRLNPREDGDVGEVCNAWMMLQAQS